METETDKIIKIGKSEIHMGPQSKRVFLLRYFKQDHHRLLLDLEKLARNAGYDKVIAKIPGYACDDFQAAGFRQEARILDYYPDGESCYFVSRFLSDARQHNPGDSRHRGIIQTASARPKRPLSELPQQYRLSILRPDDCEQMAEVYKQVFKSYPFPIFDPAYLEETMQSHVVYFGVFKSDMLVALSSAETDCEYKNAEMTDFAILPDHRGLHLARRLLAAMEKEMAGRDIRTLYTIARAESLPMNCTFGSEGYTYGGTLVNNTQISGQIESMNIWAKRIVLSDGTT